MDTTQNVALEKEDRIDGNNGNGRWGEQTPAAAAKPLFHIKQRTHLVARSEAVALHQTADSPADSCRQPLYLR